MAEVQLVTDVEAYRRPTYAESWSEEVKDYYRFEESYDWVDVADRLLGPEALFHRRRETAVARLVRRYGRAQAPMLDAGCGTGLILRHLPPGSTGLDLNPRNITIVEKRLPMHRAVLGDVEAMPFSTSYFGTVVCTEVLEHVPDPVSALREIRRVLIPGGILIGSVPARSLIWKFRFLSSTCPGDEPFHNEYRVSEVRSMLNDFGIILLKYSGMRFNVLFVARSPAARSRQGIRTPQRSAVSAL